PISSGCGLIRCPRCGYEMPPEAKLFGWLRGIRRGKKTDVLQLDDKASKGENTGTPLSCLQPNQKGTIVRLQMGNAKKLQKLLAMNLLPGVPIRLIRRSPAFVFEAGYSQFAVDESIAEMIYVDTASNRT
ncbi:MAG: ferrous iron transport protein A, partial [Anaerolineae bacterium]|nr:ferrous iron transport protein A [Anaerolineae bacterium]